MPVKRALIVPAAGRGSRLGSALPKLLVPVNGRPMIDWVLDQHASFADRFYLVVSPGAFDAVRAHFAGRDLALSLSVQPEPTGMLDAILIPAEEISAVGADE